MNITTHERPGVYSAFSAAVRVTGSGTGGAVGVAAISAGGTAGVLYPLYKHEDAVAAFGADDPLTALVRVLFLNGASSVQAVPVAGEGGYVAAFAALDRVEDLSVVVCDCTTIAVQQALKDAVLAAAQVRRERIAVLCGGAGEQVAALVARAQSLNCERVVLVGPAESGAAGALLAAAVAGAVAGERDPAVPLGGAVLKGVSGPSIRYTDSEIDTLVRGGVTPLEQLAGQCSVVRAVTTRTTTGEEPDATWRELSTIRIVDDVIPGVRRALRAKFHRAKNTQQTRGAIRTQVIVELENKLKREIITGYESVTVTSLEENPTVCLVEFSFAAARGLNQIWLSAHITV